VVNGEITLIDTGLPHKTKKILQYITTELRRKPSEVKTILLTHGDVDHIGNAEELRRLTGAKLAAHPDDAEIMAGRKTRLIPKGGMSILFKLLLPVMRTKPFQVDLLANDGDNIAGLRVIHMPGHTPGSIAFYDEKRKVLFTGDALGFRNGKVHGPSERITMDSTKAYESLEKLASFDFTVMLSGHSKPLQADASAKVREFIISRRK
jgi:glyoxylase-like metal-dependent hydrolase (beta-lactamase superfamily II)